MDVGTDKEGSAHQRTKVAARRRVVITGIGLVTPLGLDVPSTWQALIHGKSGIGPLTRFDTSTFPVTVGGEVSDFDPTPYVNDKKTLKVVTREVLFALVAARDAMQDGELLSRINDMDSERFGLFSASNGSRLESADLYSAVALASEVDGSFDIRRYGSDGIKRVFPLWLLKSLANNGLCHLSIQYNIQGANCNFVGSSTGGFLALSSGYHSIARGELDVALCISYDSLINWEDILQYSRAGFFAKTNTWKSPEQISRPFDLKRSGAVPSEGGGAILLESENHAQARGVRPYASLLGVGHSVNGASLVSPPDDGSGMRLALRKALSSANVCPDEIDCICANGSSSPQLDKSEASAICSVMGRCADDIPVTAPKSMLGHTMAASGTVETAIAAKIVRECAIPPTLNYEYPDPGCPLSVLTHQLSAHRVNTLVCLNTGLGGQNSALILGRCH